MKRLGLIAGILLVLASCNKDQRAANKLEGKWNITSYIITYESGPFDAVGSGEFTKATLDFSECDVKEGEDCNVFFSILHSDGGTESETYSYSLSDKGETLKWKYFTYSEQVFTVENLTKNEAKLVGTTFSGTYPLEITMEKED